jgi:hypothetical protein
MLHGTRNGRRARLALLGIPALALVMSGLGACLGESDHTYFDDLLDAATDASAPHLEASSDTDASQGNDGDTTPPANDGGTDAADDAGALDAAPGDAGPLADGGTDAEIESGCGSVDTVANCGACGVACDTTHSTPAACASASCTYSACAPGYGDCDASVPNVNGCETPLNTAANCRACGATCDTSRSVGAACGASGCTYTGCQAGFSMCNTAAPNANGCACATPGCCGTNCNTTHRNGLGDSFYDCVAVGSVDASTQAFKACAASKDASAQCSGGWTCPGITTQFVCDAPSTAQKNSCARCWAYQGSQTGTVQDCSCPGVVIGNWN